MKRNGIYTLAWLLLCLVGLTGCSQQDPIAAESGNASPTSAPAGDSVAGEPVGELQVADAAPASSELSDPLAAAEPNDTFAGPANEPAGDPLASAAAVHDAAAVHNPSADVEQTEPSSDTAAADAAAADSLQEVAQASEQLFQSWPTPQAVLLITGRQYGYVEPCGCAGLEFQKGGLVRRYALIQQLRSRGWKTIPIDAGNQVRRFGRQAEIKFQMTIESLRRMGYRAIAFGPDDLSLSAGELVAIIAGDEQHPSPFVATNVEVFDPSFTSAFQIVEENGVKVGITAVLGARNQKKVNNGDVLLSDAAESLAKVWPEMEQAACDHYVLIAHASIDESKQLAKEFPQFSIVVTTGGAGEPMRQPPIIEGTNSVLIQAGTKGMFAGVVGLFDDPSTPIRYQRVPLDGRFKDTDVMLQLLAAYQDRLKEAGWDGLGIRTQRHPTGRTFVGSDACGDCHPGVYDIWKDGLEGEGGPHAKAYHTLLHPPERSEIARNFDPECVSCHVVGWNSQKYFPYESGYISQEKTPDKLNVGCENCHSPGSAHVEAEYGDVELDDAEIDRRRQQMVLPLIEAERTCLECHDLDNSPDFHEKGAFARYWKKIRH